MSFVSFVEKFQDVNEKPSVSPNMPVKNVNVSESHHSLGASISPDQTQKQVRIVFRVKTVRVNLLQITASRAKNHIYV